VFKYFSAAQMLSVSKPSQNFSVNSGMFEELTVFSSITCLKIDRSYVRCSYLSR